MAKKKNHSNDNEKQNDSRNVTVVLKIEWNCEGCRREVVNAIRSLDGVETVKPGDYESYKVTVIGKVDPYELWQAVKEKIKEKVELISPVTKKQDDKFPVTKRVLKMPLHCQDCSIEKIKKFVKKTEGVKEITVLDESNGLVTVKGGMDMKLLTADLEERFKTKIWCLDVDTAHIVEALAMDKSKLKDELKATKSKLKDELKATKSKLEDELKATKSKLEDELKDTKSKLESYEKLFYIMLVSLLLIFVGIFIGK